MIIGVTGYNGQLGRELVKRNNCYPLVCDVTDRYSVMKTLRNLKPDVVVHCAAKTNVDACEDDIRGAVITNVIGTENISTIFDGLLIYMSTDFVFDGNKGPYFPLDPVSPIGIYGWSKLGGELVVKNRKDKGITVRTTNLFSDTSNNFVMRVLNKLRTGKKISLPIQMRGNPTFVPHLVDGILGLIGKDAPQIVHIAGREVVSRYELGKQIARNWGYSESMIVKGQVRGKANRPHDAGLVVSDSIKLKIPIYSYLEGLRIMKEKG